MEESKLLAIHDNLAKYQNKKKSGLGVSNVYNFAGSKSKENSNATSAIREDGLPNNNLYVNFVREGTYDPSKESSTADIYGDGRHIKRNFEDCATEVSIDSSSSEDENMTKEQRKELKKEKKKAAKKAAKLAAKKQAKLEAKLAAKNNQSKENESAVNDETKNNKDDKIDSSSSTKKSKKRKKSKDDIKDCESTSKKKSKSDDKDNEISDSKASDNDKKKKKDKKKKRS